MTSPIPPIISGRESSVQRFITPAVQVVTAAVILFTGAGISAIFWKMPTSAEFYDLYQTNVIDKELAEVPLPSDAVAVISPEEMQQVLLPTLDTTPSADSGVEKYAQVYEAPASLLAIQSEIDKTPVSVEKSSVESTSPQKFTPMRHIVEKKPINIESVNDAFQPKPSSVSTTEKSDELLATFQFAENNKSDYVNNSELDLPSDPFPVMTVAPSQLQPLQPLSSGSLSPLLPL